MSSLESFDQVLDEVYNVAQTLDSTVFDASDIAEEVDISTRFVSNRLHEMSLRDSYELYLIEDTPQKVFSTDEDAEASNYFQSLPEGFTETLNALNYQKKLSSQEIYTLGRHFSSKSQLSAQISNAGKLKEELKESSEIDYLIESDEYIWTDETE